MRFRYVTPALVAVALGCAFALPMQGCGNGEKESETGEVSAALVGVEIAKNADIVYDIRQPELGGGWQEKLSIRQVGTSSRRMTIDKGALGTHVVFTDHHGALDGRTEGLAALSRIDAFSTSPSVGIGARWSPLSTAPRVESGGDAIQTDKRRSFQTSGLWEVEGGYVFRALVNLRSVIDENSEAMKSRGFTNENWPLRDSVVGVGIVDYFASSSGRQTYLLREAEYTFATSIPSAELAVSSLEDLRVRLAEQETVLTLRCLVSGPPNVVAAASNLREPDGAFGLVACAHH